MSDGPGFNLADKEKRISVGIHPEVSLKLARQRRDEARKLLARDIDPSAYRKAQKQSRRQWARNSFEAVATEWLAKHSPNWSTGRYDRDSGLAFKTCHTPCGRLQIGRARADLPVDLPSLGEVCSRCRGGRLPGRWQRHRAACLPYWLSLAATSDWEISQ